MRYLLFLCLLYVSSCSSTKNTLESQTYYLFVELKAEADGDTLMNTYLSDGIESAKRNSRAKNTYTCTFNSTQKAIEKLIKRMSQDINIIQVYQLENESKESPSNSTNSKSGKAKPGSK